MRIEATADLRFNKASIDPSNGASTYWLHLSAANGNHTVSGGYTLDMKPRMTAKAVSIIINGVSSDKPMPKTPPGKPTVATVLGTCSYGAKDYNFRADLTSDYFKPAGAPGARPTKVRGTIRLKLTDPATKSTFTAANDQRSSVTVWVE